MIEHGRESMNVRQMELAQRRDHDIQPQWIDVGMKFPFGNAAIEQAFGHRQHWRRHLVDAWRLLHVTRLGAIFGPEKANQMTVAFEVPVHEIKQSKQAFQRIEMFDIERQFLGPQRRQSAFERRKIQRGLAAKALVEHPWIGACLAHNAADAATGQTMSCEFRGGGAQNLQAVLLRGTAGTASRRCLTLARSGVGCGIPISHACSLELTRFAHGLPISSSARSWPDDARMDKPTGHPSTRPTGTLICGSPAWPAIDVKVSARG